MCSECKKIKISESPDVWLGEENGSEKYHNLLKENKISHGYCMPCAIKKYPYLADENISVSNI